MSANMFNLDSQKKAPSGDWHRADIKAALEKRGLSLSRLALKNGYARSSVSTALSAPWPRMERLIAKALGVQPMQIWPSRYHEDGRPKSGRGERGLGRWKKHNTGTEQINVEDQGGNRHATPQRRTHS